MKNTKNIMRLAALLLAAVCLLPFAGCREKEAERPSATLSYEGVAIDECIRLGEYENLTVTLTSADADKGAAVWEAVLLGCEIMQYPEEAVAYYVAQEEARCLYYAKQEKVSEEEAMIALGTSREQMEADAHRLVALDLCERAVQAKAGIALTDDEKTRLFDRYADKYVSDFGYDRDYVKENLSDLVYASMLYDKTTEYLILHNTFVY